MICSFNNLSISSLFVYLLFVLLINLIRHDFLAEKTVVDF